MNDVIHDKTNHNHNTLTSAEIGSITNTLLHNQQHQQLLQLIDEVVTNPSLCESDELCSCILNNSEIRSKLSVNTLCTLLTSNFKLFERYLMEMIKNMFQKYPLLRRNDVKQICEQNRLFEVCLFFPLPR